MTPPPSVGIASGGAAMVHERSGRPVWARWSSELYQPYTIGLEEEVMLLDPSSWALAQSGDRALSQLSDQLSAHAAAETHACVIELVTDIHADVDSAVAELGSLRHSLRHELAEMGLTAAAAGMHPLAVGDETRLSAAPRYQRIADSMRMLVRREPTMAMHVHIGIPEPDDAVRVLNGLRRWVPALLALSSNSPFWRGRDGGFASSRTLVFGAFPRTGLPGTVGSYADYVATLDALMLSDAVPDPNSVWWDVRLQPPLGTVEVRVMDTQSTVREATPLIALVQSLARLELEGDGAAATPGPEVLAENRFLAARDGMAARLLDPTAPGRLIPVREMLDALLAECRPHALALGCLDSLERVPRLAAANGADRQRAWVRAGASLEQVVERLAERFLAPAWPSRSHARPGEQI
jgi:carboxylate-amine ligase